MLGVGQRTTDISVRTAFGQSGRDGWICKYTFNKGAGIILINNNTGLKQAVLAFSKANTGDYRITAIHTDNGWGSLMKDSENNLYIRHSSDWGSHLIICSMSITPDGYVTSTEGLTDITVS